MASSDIMLADAPSAVEEKKKTADDTNTDEEPPAALSNTAQDAAEYPQGVKLAIIVVALVLSIFLMSLDMVSISTSLGHFLTF